jgi:DNA-binding SARP family transcriptional activator
LRVWDPGGGVDLPVRPQLPRRVLAVLLLYAGRSCRASWLAQAIWDRQQPADRAGALRAVIYSLRRCLGALGQRVETSPDGYLFGAGDDEVDAGRFRRLAREGRDAWYRGDAAGASRLLGAASGMWREPALADLPSTAPLSGIRRWLARERADVQDLHVDARLMLGEHRAVISELRGTVLRDPLREHAWAQLVLALYRDGGLDAALAVFRDARAVLQREYGTGPGPELAELRQQITAGRVALPEQVRVGRNRFA